MPHIFNEMSIQFINILIFIFPAFFIILILFTNKSYNLEISKYKPANSWERTTAYIFDIIICTSIMTIIYSIIENINIKLSLNHKLIGQFIFMFVYFSIFENSFFIRSTPGKRINRLFIIDKNGDKITLSKSFTRFLLFYASVLSFFIGHISILFTKNKTGIHDILSHSYVVKDSYDDEM